jgi:hypothetical protein
LSAAPLPVVAAGPVASASAAADGADSDDPPEPVDENDANWFDLEVLDQGSLPAGWETTDAERSDVQSRDIRDLAEDMTVAEVAMDDDDDAMMAN